MKRIFSLIMALILVLSLPTVSLGKDSFNVEIDDQMVQVFSNVNLQLNDQAAYSEFQPFIYKDRTYVPIRFIAEYFDADVDWIGSNKDVIITKGGSQLKITINSDQAMKNGQVIPLASDSIPKLVSYPGEIGKTVVPLRAVSELLGYNVDWDRGSRTAIISNQVKEEVQEESPIIDENLQVESAETQISNYDPNLEIIENTEDIKALSNITGVSKTNYNGKDGILIEGVNGSQYETFRLDNPGRYVIDIKDADCFAGNNTSTHSIPVGVVDQVRINDRYIDGKDTGNVRVVLDGSLEGNIEIIETDQGLVLIPSERIVKAYTKTEDTIVEEKSVEESIPKKVQKTINSRSDVNIVIDAGHGGSDPGALSAEGDREKDINLQVAKRVSQLLRDQGYNVIETRSSDYFIPVRDRAIKANEVGGDVFVSIHVNSATTSSATGIETFYAPKDLVTTKTEDQYPFAKSVHDGLISATGVYDRGVKSGPRLIVLNSTTMPAALVELGFLSNGKDLDKLQDDGYLEKCAQGLAKGINNYLVGRYGL